MRLDHAALGVRGPDLLSAARSGCPPLPDLARPRHASKGPVTWGKTGRNVNALFPRRYPGALTGKLLAITLGP